MNANLIIPFKSYLFMETFRVPKFGRWLLRSFTGWSRDIYLHTAFALLRATDLALADKIRFQQSESIYLKYFQRIKKRLSIVHSAIPQNSDDQNINSIKESIEISLKAVDELIKIIHDKLDYYQLKKDMFSVSSSAILSNLGKYR